MLCSRFLSPPTEQHNALYRASEKVFDGMRDVYDWTLRGVLRHRFLTMIVAAGTVVSTYYLFGLVPKGFIPSQDIDQLSGITEARQDISYDAIVKQQAEVAAVLQADPSIEAFNSSVGNGPSGGGNTGRFFIRLRPRTERTLTPEQVIEHLRPKLDAIPGMRTFLQNPPLVRIGGMQSRSLYQFTLQSPDINSLYRSAQEFEKQMKTIPTLSDVTSDLLISSPMLTVEIDRDRASSLGVTEDQIENALYDSYGARQVSSIYTSIDTYWVIMEMKPEFQRDPKALGMLYVRSSAGKLVPLREVAKLKPGSVGPLAVSAPGAISVRHDLIQHQARRFPGRCGGEGAGVGARNAPGKHEHQFPRHGRGVPIFVTRHGIAAGDGDFGDLHGVGGFVRELHSPHHDPFRPAVGRTRSVMTLLIFHDELNIYSFVGIIMLIGIVKKNAIMMIDFALETQHAPSRPVRRKRSMKLASSVFVRS